MIKRPTTRTIRLTLPAGLLRRLESISRTLEREPAEVVRLAVKRLAANTGVTAAEVAARTRFDQIIAECGALLSAATVRIKKGEMRPAACRRILNLTRQRAVLAARAMRRPAWESIPEAERLLHRLRAVSAPSGARKIKRAKPTPT